MKANATICRVCRSFKLRSFLVCLREEDKLKLKNRDKNNYKRTYYNYIINPCNTRNTAVRVHGMRGVPKSNTVPVPALPVLETPRVFPYPCGTLSISEVEVERVEVMNFGDGVYVMAF
jgi:hypothetical protein